jgi:hypothetical protein
MKRVSYQDSEGRNWATLLPEDMPDTHASMGLPLGPPSLATLELPLDAEVRLHNQLYARGIFTYDQAKAARQEIFAALQAAFKTDTDAVVQLYNAPQELAEPETNGSEPKKKVAAKRR